MTDIYGKKLILMLGAIVCTIGLHAQSTIPSSDTPLKKASSIDSAYVARLDTLKEGLKVPYASHTLKIDTVQKNVNDDY
jgi:hypothetical protein